jgi:protein tyrosine phosphatase (PTP) superfamily phosphohydrolase (DUF442 family)
MRSSPRAPRGRRRCGASGFLRTVLLQGAAWTLIAAGCVSPSVPSATPAPEGCELATRCTDAQGIENFARVDANLYRGAFPSPAGVRYLQALGVKTVVCFRQRHSCCEEVEAAGLTYVDLGLQAGIFGSEPPTEDQVQRFFSVLLDPARQPVFICCKRGKDRTGTMAALYRLEVDGWTNAEAIQEMQAFGYHDIYRDLIRFVRAYRPRGFTAPAPES